MNQTAEKLHAQIMNLPLGPGASEWKTDTLLYPYKCGHRDARHAAAELALAAPVSPAAAPSLESADPERFNFVLAQCREAQELATRYGWALNEIAGMTFDAWTNGAKAGDVARQALLGRQEGAADEGVARSDSLGHQTERAGTFPDAADGGRA